jgi:hypothetical protein
LIQVIDVVNILTEIVGTCYFFITNFGWTFAMLLAVISFFKYLEMRKDNKKRLIKKVLEQ